MSTPGLHLPDGRFIPIGHRQELATPSVQRTLATWDDGSPGRCGCGHAVYRRTDARLLGFYNLKNVSVDNVHRSGCPADPTHPLRLPVVYSGGMLNAPAWILHGANGSSRQTQKRARHGSFTHAMHIVFARASMLAHRRANAGRNFRSHDLRCFTRMEIDAAIAEILRGTVLSDGSRLWDYLETCGLEIAWGSASDEVATNIGDAMRTSSGLNFYCPGYCSTRSVPSGVGCMLRMSPGVVAAASARQFARGTLIGGPYFWFASISRRTARPHWIEFEVSRFLAFPIAGEEAPFHIDSDLERSAVKAGLMSLGAVLKPGVHYPLKELGDEYWPFGVDHRGSLPHRVDAILFSGGEVWLVEIAGFETDPAYMSQVRRRLLAMSSVANGRMTERVKIAIMNRSDVGASAVWRQKASELF